MNVNSRAAYYGASRGQEYSAPHEITMSEVLSRFNNINALVSSDAASQILEAYIEGASPDSKAFGLVLDQRATRLHAVEYTRNPFVTRIATSEGRKEHRKAREDGETIELEILSGVYGKGVMGDENIIDWDIEVAVDPIEGTTLASLNQDGAVSIISGTLSGHISEAPPEESDAIYADRIVAPPRLKDLVSVANTPDQNLAAVMDAYGLTNPADATFVILGRPRNQRLIDDLAAFGAGIKLIDSGDLMPAIKALTEDKPYVSIGSGGKDEAIIAAAAAKAVGGAFDLRYVTKLGDRSEEYKELRRLDDVASGNSGDYFVSFASVTGVKTLGIPRPALVPANGVASHWEVPVGMITAHSGLVRARMEVRV